MANNGTECPDPDDPLCPPEFPTVEPPSTPLPGIVALGYTKDLHELLDLHMTPNHYQIMITCYLKTAGIDLFTKK